MTESPDDVIRRELTPSEQLLWAGRPRQGFVLRPLDALLIPISMLWGGFFIFWMVQAMRMGGVAIFFALVGVPFVLIGLYLMVGRFWVSARRRARTTYGVTSERILIVSDLRTLRVQSLRIDTVTEVSLTERPNGSGIITFEPVHTIQKWFIETGWPGVDLSDLRYFHLSEGVRSVHDIVLGAQHAARKQDDTKPWSISPRKHGGPGAA